MVQYNPFIRIGQFYRELTHVKTFKAALNRPREAQESKLLEILNRNANSEFGKKHGFTAIRSIKDYQRQVMPCVYEDLEPYIEKSMSGVPAQLSTEKPLMYATTSGTTGKPKYIPITPSHLRDYTHAFQVHNWSLVKDHWEAAHYPRAKILIFNSNDEEGHTADGTPFGAVSGLLRRRQSRLVQRYFALPPLISRIKNVESKYYSILRLSLSQEVVAIMSCNPSTLLLLADELKNHSESLIKDIFDGSFNSEFSPQGKLAEELKSYLRADRDCARRISKILERDGVLLPRTVWPALQFLNVWKGGPMPFYLDKLPEKFGDVPIRDFGYMASEGRGTIPLSDEGAGGVAALTSHFFEFVPEEEENRENRRFLCLDELELGKRYFIHFTTASGLYRYNINDLMEVVGFEERTPILRFVQKGMGVSSVTGEKLTEEQVSTALSYALRQNSMTAVEHFILSVKMESRPFYCGFIESAFELSEPVLSAMARTLDQSLQVQNIEYQDKRRSMRLGPVQLETVPAGTFRKLRQKRVLEGAPEAQVKIPFLTSNSNFYRDIAKLANTELVLQSK